MDTEILNRELSETEVLKIYTGKVTEVEVLLGK